MISRAFVFALVWPALLVALPARADDALVPWYHGIRRFQEVEAGKVYRGPGLSREEFDDVMTRFDIRTDITFENLPLQAREDRKHSRELEQKDPRHHVTPLAAPWTALPWETSPGTVFRAIDDIGNPDLQPVYFHCTIGRERTGLIAALYRIYYQGWSQAAAWEEWTRVFGFADSWYSRNLFRGVTSFFRTHSDPLPYWSRHPVLRARLGADPGRACESFENSGEADLHRKGGREVFCRAGTVMILARTFLAARSKDGTTLAQQALLRARGGAGDCERSGGVEQRLSAVARPARLDVCRFTDGSAIEARALERSGQESDDAGLAQVLESSREPLSPESTLIGPAETGDER